MSDLIGKDDVWTSDVGKLRADLAAAQAEVAAWKAVANEWRENGDEIYAGAFERRVAELLKEGWE